MKALKDEFGTGSMRDMVITNTTIYCAYIDDTFFRFEFWEMPLTAFEKAVYSDERKPLFRELV
jgi:hypothetical protein